LISLNSRHSTVSIGSVSERLLSHFSVLTGLASGEVT
jgi:hypothetical protein